MNPLIMQAVRNGGAVASAPAPAPAPFDLSFNFRASQTPGTNWTGDVAPEIGIYGSPSTQLWNGTWGYNAPGVAVLDSGRLIDRRLYGRHTLNSAGSSFAIAAPGTGSYGLEFAMGAASVADARTAVVIADSVDGGMRVGTLNAILATSGNASAGQYYVTNDQQRIYRCTTAGTYTTGNPVGTGTGISDGGGAEFSFAGNVIFIYDSGGGAGSLPATSVVDIDGVVRTEGAWPTGGGSAPKFKSLALGGASPGITVLKYPASITYVRHVRLFAL